MSACTYCGLDAYNVIEVRYARTLKHASSGVSEEEAPREVLGRGYYVCDGCLALLDYHVEHHLEPRKHATFNVLSSVYHLLVVWGAVAVGSAASSHAVLVRTDFLTLGLVLAISSLVVWFLRASVHSQYYGSWRADRVDPKPYRPANSLGAMTDLRDRVNPEFNTYLPVRWEDSLKLAALKGSPPIRCLGPNAEPWGDGPQTNFTGRGANEYYRLVWISWQLWPLNQVLEPEGTEWKPPPPPPITEMEVAVATDFAAASFAALALAPAVPIIAAIVVGIVAWPIGFVVGRQARALWERRKIERSSRPVV
jgi:hypothetical protein